MAHRIHRRGCWSIVHWALLNRAELSSCKPLWNRSTLVCGVHSPEPARLVSHDANGRAGIHTRSRTILQGSSVRNKPVDSRACSHFLACVEVDRRRLMSCKGHNSYRLSQSPGDARIHRWNIPICRHCFPLAKNGKGVVYLPMGFNMICTIMRMRGG